MSFTTNGSIASGCKTRKSNIYYLNIESNIFLSKHLFRNRFKNKLGILLTDLILDKSVKDFDDSVPFTICKLKLASKIHSGWNTNSRFLDLRPTTKDGCPPIIIASSHEFQTWLTILKQAKIIEIVVVKPRKTIIILDFKCVELTLVVSF